MSLLHNNARPAHVVWIRHRKSPILLTGSGTLAKNAEDVFEWIALFERLGGQEDREKNDLFSKYSTHNT